jgi:hypothetical protein
MPVFCAQQAWVCRLETTMPDDTSKTGGDRKFISLEQD